MNLHAIASKAIAAVNPNRYIMLERSTGYTTSPDGVRVPTYAPAQRLLAQVQDMTQGDVRKLDGLNIEGERRKAYFTGYAAGVIRVLNFGGDLITLPDGTLWLVVASLETWPDWVCVALVLQKPKPVPVAPAPGP
jgi:hypothetical protein